MKQLLAIIALGFGLTMAPARAEACRIPLPAPPVNPEIYEAIAIATAIGRGADSMRADLRVDETIYGPVEAAEFHLSSEFISLGGCEPLYRVEPGGRLLILLGRDRAGGQIVSRWLPLDAPPVRADPFLVLYFATGERAARERLIAHWRQVIRFGGPVPLTDPSRWLAPAAGWLGRTAWPSSARAEFEIGDDGRVANCRIVESRMPGPRDATICPNLASRSFERPLLPAERRGVYEVRWDVSP